MAVRTNKDRRERNLGQRNDTKNIHILWNAKLSHSVNRSDVSHLHGEIIH
jgi:hypothetical protein